jgi:5-methylcytosine-specific restriction endonuclease McrA
MKICWDMLEGVYLTKNGNFRVGENTYVEMDACKLCGEPYLTVKNKPSIFCGFSCARSGENGPMYGKHHTIETRRKIAKSNSINTIGSLNPNYKGGIYTRGLTVYDTYKDRLGIYEDIRKQKNTEVLEARCVYCGKWYMPTHEEVRHRLAAINSLDKGEARLYCSENCKRACPTYGQRVYPKGFKHVSSREVNPYLRQMVLERDNWTCQICGKTVKEAELHVHHMDPVTQNPMFQNDANSCITLCKGCHQMVHKQIGCRYVDLRCKKETDYTRKFKEDIRSKSMNSRE